MMVAISLVDVSAALCETLIPMSDYRRGKFPALDALADQVVMYNVSTQRYSEIEREVNTWMAKRDGTTKEWALRGIINDDRALQVAFAREAAFQLTKEQP